MILLDGPLTQAEAVEIGTRAIKAMDPSQRLLGIDVHISASIGIASYPRDGTSVDMLLARADAAMYTAKERGRNNLQCYAEGMSTMTQDRVKFEATARSPAERTVRTGLPAEGRHRDGWLNSARP